MEAFLLIVFFAMLLAACLASVVVVLIGIVGCGLVVVTACCAWAVTVSILHMIFG